MGIFILLSSVGELSCLNSWKVWKTNGFKWPHPLVMLFQIMRYYRKAKPVAKLFKSNTMPIGIKYWYFAYIQVMWRVHQHLGEKNIV